LEIDKAKVKPNSLILIRGNWIYHYSLDSLSNASLIKNANHYIKLFLFEEIKGLVNMGTLSSLGEQYKEFSGFLNVKTLSFV
jgi:hypothetical protein